MAKTKATTALSKLRALTREPIAPTPFELEVSAAELRGYLEMAPMLISMALPMMGTELPMDAGEKIVAVLAGLDASVKPGARASLSLNGAEVVAIKVT